MADTKLQVFTQDNLALYDELLKGYVDAEDAKSLKTVAIDGNTLKFYRVSEPVGDTAPAYTINLPETDLSGLIPKITGATAGNVVTAKADGTVEDSGIKAADLATKAEVKAVEDKADANKASIDAINNADTGILKTAKDYADSKVKDLADGAVATNTSAIATLNGDETTAGSVKKAVKDASDTINATIGTVAEGKTVVQMIEDAKTASTYDDTEVKASIKANTDAITVLNGTGEGSVSKQVADAVASIVADAPEAYDTLKEISDWISSHADDAVAMNSQINTNKTDIASLKALVGTLPEGAASTTIVEYIAEAIGASSTDLTDAIATAKQEAIDAAATDATTKANAAETNAKAAVSALENGAVKTNADNITALQELVGNGYEPIPEASIRALFATN